MNQFSAESQKATAYCTYCPKMCRFSCPAAEAEKRETVTPWGMMRLLEVAKDGAVELSEEVAETFYHCTGCRRCQTWCKHDNDVPEALWQAREWARDEGFVPEAVSEVTERCRQRGAPFEEDAPALSGVHGFEMEEIFDPGADVVYIPDCQTRWRDPAAVARTGLLLEIFTGMKVRLHAVGAGVETGSRGGDSVGCCGFPLLAGGDTAGWRRHQRELEAKLGDVDQVVTGCASWAAADAEGTSWNRPGELEVVHLVEYLADRLEFVEPRRTVELEGLMIHDSCYVGRQLGLYEEVRRLVAAFCGGTGGEFEFARDEAPCCGAAGLYDVVAPEAAERCAADRLGDLEREGGEALACGSANCKYAFREADEAEGDGRIVDVLELAFRAFELD